MNLKLLIDNLSKVTVLSEIARTGSLHKAAGALHISQPSLSVKLKQIEDIFETEIFIRSPQGLKVTPEGQQIINYVNEILDLSQGFLRDLKAEAKIAARIKIGIYESIARYFWPQFYKYYTEKFPHVSFQLITGRSLNLSQMLKDRNIDYAISIDPGKRHGIFSEPLFSDSYSFYASLPYLNQIDLGESKIGKKALKVKSWDQIAKAKFIVFTDLLDESGKSMANSLAERGFSGDPILEVENYEIALEFCLLGLGIAALPNLVARKAFEFGNTKNALPASNADGALVKIDLPDIDSIDFNSHNIGISFLQNTNHKTLHDEFFDEINKYCQEYFPKS